MVKNKTGGNRSKKVARKNAGDPSLIQRKLRFVDHEDEMYAIVTKMVGNGQIHVLGSDDKERLCFIRYKFAGRNKHSNLITLGSWVIIGNRSWETVIDGKLPKCDLLEIYTNQEKNRLTQECRTNLLALLKEEQKQMNLDEHSTTYNEDVNHGIVFSTEYNEPHDNSSDKLKEDDVEEDDFEIDFDDI